MFDVCFRAVLYTVLFPSENWIGLSIKASVKENDGEQIAMKGTSGLATRM